MATRAGLPRRPRWLARLLLGPVLLLGLAVVIFLTFYPPSNIDVDPTTLDKSPFLRISGIFQRPQETSPNTCELAPPSEADLAALRAGGRAAAWGSGASLAEKELGGQQGEASLMTCQVHEPCRGSEGPPPPVVCRAPPCQAFRLVRAGHLHGETLTLSQLEDRLRRAGFAGNPRSGPLDWGQEVWCLGGPEVPLLLRRVVLRQQPCPPPPPSPAPASPHVNIHVFFVRFLSRRSLLTSMEHLPSVLTEMGMNNLVLDFRKYQSQEFKEVQNLKTFLQGGGESGSLADGGSRTLLDAAADSGFQTTLLDAGCFRSAARAQLLHSLVRKEFAVPASFLRNHDACNFTLGSDQSDELLYYTYLHNALAKVHGVSGVYEDPVQKASRQDFETSKPRRKLFISLLDMDTECDEREKPWSVDLALADVIHDVGRQPDSVVALLSDVGQAWLAGDPGSVFLRTQLANPFFFLALPRSLASYLGPQRVTTLQKNTQKLLTLDDIQATIRDLLRLLGERGLFNKSDGVSVTSSPPRTFLTAESGARGRGEGRGVSTLSQELPGRGCEALRVQPPGLCLCQAQAVAYPNDSLQVSVAEMALGLWNNRLAEELQQQQQQQRGYNATALHLLSCRLLRGITFSQVKLRWVGSKVRVSLTIAARHGAVNITFANVTVDLVPRQEGYLLAKVWPHPKLNNVRTSCREPSQFSSLDKISSVPESMRMTSASPLGFGMVTKSIRVHEDCLFVFVRAFKGTTVYEALNDCHDRIYDVTFDVSLVNMISMVELPVEWTLGPGEVRMLTVVRKQSYVTRLYSRKHHVHFAVTYFQ